MATRKKAPPIDVETEARKLISGYGTDTDNVYYSEFYKHVFDIKQMIPKLDGRFEGHIERDVHIGDIWLPYHHEDGRITRQKYSKRGYALTISWRPALVLESLLGNVQAFAQKNDLKAVYIGQKRVY